MNSEITGEFIRRKQLCGVDIAKFVGAILVVAIHTHPLRYGSTLDYYFNCLCRIAVPFFFVSTSYFFYSGGGNIEKYVKRMLILYTLWFIIELPLTIKVFFYDTDYSFKLNLLYFIRGLFVNNTFFASWFLTASVESMILVYLLRNHRVLSYIVAITCFVTALMWSMWYGIISKTDFCNYFDLFGRAFMPANSFIIAVPYILIGKHIAENKSINIPTIFLWIFVLLGLIEIHLCRKTFNKPIDDVYISLIPITATLFVYLKNLKSTNNPQIQKLSNFMRKSSILIYLLHCIFIYLLTQTELLKRMGLFMPSSMFVVVLILSFLTSFVIIYLSHYYIVLKRLY